MSFRVERVGLAPSQVQKSGSSKTSDTDFRSVLSQTCDEKKELKVSAHAKRRMDERQIHLERSDMEVLSDAVEELEKKGSKESLMLYKDIALITSIGNRTIITAMKDKEVDIVTNIDSAVIVK